MKPLEKKHRNDLILIAVLLAAAGIAFGIIQLGKKSGGYAVVVQDGKEVATYPLNVDTSVTINSPTGFNTLVIKDGKADVTDADCPDKLCVNQHSISYDGETLRTTSGMMSPALRTKMRSPTRISLSEMMS